MEEARPSTDIPLRTVAGKSDGGERFEMDSTRPIKIIIVNFDPELNHPHHAEVWTPLKEVVEAALGVKERQAREDLWQHFDHTARVDSIKEAVERVKRVAEEFSGDIIGIVSSRNCNRLAFFHGEQSNSFKPVTDTFRELPGGKVVAIVTQDYVKEGAEMMWRSASVTLGMEMQVQSSAMTGDRGLVLSWYKRPYTVHGRASAAFVLETSRGREDQAFALQPLPVAVSTRLDMGADPVLSTAYRRQSPASTDEEGDAAERTHLLRNQANRSSKSAAPWRVFVTTVAQAAENLWRLLRSPPEQQQSIRDRLTYGVVFIMVIILLAIFLRTPWRFAVPGCLFLIFSYLLYRLPPISTLARYVLRCRKKPSPSTSRRLPSRQQTQFHLIYRTDTFNREVKPQVEQFVNNCLAGTDPLTDTGVAANAEWPIQKSHLPSREILQSWVFDSEGFHNVAVLFTAADAYYENPSQLDDDISALRESGFKHCIICAMFDAGFLDYPEDMDRIRSARLERRVTVPGGPVSLVSWYSRPANAIARELLRTGVIPSR